MNKQLLFIVCVVATVFSNAHGGNAPYQDNSLGRLASHITLTVVGGIAGCAAIWLITKQERGVRGAAQALGYAYVATLFGIMVKCEGEQAWTVIKRRYGNTDGME